MSGEVIVKRLQHVEDSGARPFSSSSGNDSSMAQRVEFSRIHFFADCSSAVFSGCSTSFCSRQFRISAT